MDQTARVRLPPLPTIEFDPAADTQDPPYRTFLLNLTHRLCRTVGENFATIRKVVPIVATLAGLELLILCNRNAVHRSRPDNKNHITVDVNQDTYHIGRAHINLKGWDGRQSIEAAEIESITIGPPVRWVWEPRR